MCLGLWVERDMVKLCKEKNRYLYTMMGKVMDKIIKQKEKAFKNAKRDKDKCGRLKKK